MSLDSKPILDFCIASANLNKVLEFATKNATDEAETYIEAINYFAYIDDPNLLGIPENYFDVTGTEFYEINDIQGGSNPSKTSDGKPDVISTLYNDDAVDQYVTYPEAYQNGYEVIST